jgi:hypothetical protein
MCKRNEGESMEDYRARRTKENKTNSAHLQGVVVVTGIAENRKVMHELKAKSKHHGSRSNMAGKAVAKRRKNKLLKRKSQHITAAS